MYYISSFSTSLDECHSFIDAYAREFAQDCVYYGSENAVAEMRGLYRGREVSTRRMNTGIINSYRADIVKSFVYAQMTQIAAGISRQSQDERNLTGRTPKKTTAKSNAYSPTSR